MKTAKFLYKSLILLGIKQKSEMGKDKEFFLFGQNYFLDPDLYSIKGTV